MELSSIYSAAAEGIVAVDRKGTVLYINRMALKILGIPADGIVGSKFVRKIQEYGANDEFVDAILDVIYCEQKKVAREVVYRTPSKDYSLYMSSVFVEDHGFTGLIIAFSDITALRSISGIREQLENRRQMNRQLSEQNEILTEAFSHRLDDSVVEELLNSPSGIGNHMEIRKMALFMLMSPMVQAPISDMAPRDYLKMLNHYYDAVISAIRKNGGTIFELHSDVILAGFGAPKRTENFTDKAFAAADEIQKTMAAVNQWNREMGYPELAVKIGIHTGEFPVGVIGGRNVSKYNVFGKNINFTARITITAWDGEIVMTEDTWKEIKGRCEVYDRYEVIPKGISHPVTIYKVRN